MRASSPIKREGVSSSLTRGRKPNVAQLVEHQKQALFVIHAFSSLEKEMNQYKSSYSQFRGFPVERSRPKLMKSFKGDR
jgi:hypothetical protein